jgi:hypothetical protein
MVAERFKRKIAEMYFLGIVANEGSPSRAARGKAFCDEEMTLKLGGF